jgi:hypothetical protein
MTTNVFDGHVGLMTSDSRWSNCSLGYVIVYVDDADFEKIICTDRLAFMFAGDAAKINQWKRWALDPNSVMRTVPDPDGVAMCMVDIATREIRREFDCDPECVDEKARFAGTGAKPAFKCWSGNRDARKAVLTAIDADRFSGGPVKFFEFETKLNNLSKVDRFESIGELMQNKGKFMPIKPSQGQVGVEYDVETGDEAVKALARKIVSGQASMEAPTTTKNTWTPEQKQQLYKVLAEYYPA